MLETDHETESGERERKRYLFLAVLFQECPEKKTALNDIAALFKPAWDEHRLEQVALQAQHPTIFEGFASLPEQPAPLAFQFMLERVVLDGPCSDDAGNIARNAVCAAVSSWLEGCNLGPNLRRHVLRAALFDFWENADGLFDGFHFQSAVSPHNGMDFFKLDADPPPPMPRFSLFPLSQSADLKKFRAWQIEQKKWMRRHGITKRRREQEVMKHMAWAAWRAGHGWTHREIIDKWAEISEGQSTTERAVGKALAILEQSARLGLN
jgi:hypothetical protein